jgi:hypothetical protein
MTNYDQVIVSGTIKSIRREFSSSCREVASQHGFKGTLDKFLTTRIGVTGKIVKFDRTLKVGGGTVASAWVTSETKGRSKLRIGDRVKAEISAKSSIGSQACVVKIISRTACDLR